MLIKHPLYFTPILVFALLIFEQPLHAQTCRNDITPTTPSQDFTNHDDGTVTHRKTGLMWMRCALGQSWNGAGCTGDTQSYTWQDALQVADGFSFAGHSDWRLPDIKELGSIVEQACFSPAINATVFPATPSITFWSASLYAGSVFYAWNVDFINGFDYFDGKILNGYVRFVRGGQ